MKSLVESLFDKNLSTKEHPYEKLLTSFISKNDINSMVFNAEDGRGGKKPLKNKYLGDWLDHWTDTYIKPGIMPLYFCRYGRIDPWPAGPWPDNQAANKEAENWLNMNEIHYEVHFNDAMYANTFDISWSTWGLEKQWNNITEWIAWKCKAYGGNYVMILINRKDYDEWDQQVIHKLIEIINKKGSR